MGKQAAARKVTSVKSKIAQHVKTQKKKKSIERKVTTSEAPVDAGNATKTKEKRVFKSKVVKGTGIGSLKDLKAALESSIVDDDTNSEEPSSRPKSTKGKITRRQKMALEVEDKTRLSLVFENSDFQANPFESMLNHLKSQSKSKNKNS
eukprot:TRINITY_DN7523_c0_g1_i1.p1 TRINITY_DN7523_c0_g1~~TRINITY_DN7523_c0_g1_i1.p1  ORF type:complete len:164 (-),score=43.55 TRINITY_DN7523_c0_g1_i1:17-463(-)